MRVYTVTMSLTSQDMQQIFFVQRHLDGPSHSMPMVLCRVCGYSVLEERTVTT